MCKNMHIRHLTNLNFNFLKNSLSKNLYILTKGSFYSLHLQISLVLIEGNLLHKAGQIQRQAVSNGFHHIQELANYGGKIFKRSRINK